LTHPSGLALGPNGDVFVADDMNNVVHEFDGATGAYLASPVSTKAPSDVTFGPDGNMYVAVAGGVVVRYTSAGASPVTFVQGPSEIGGLRFNGTDLFVSYAGSPGSLVQYDAKGNKVAEIFNQFAGGGPRAPSFGLDGTMFVPEWQTPYVKAFAAGSYKPLGNFINDREVSPNSVGFAIDGAMLVLSNNTKESSVRRYDPATGTFLSVLIPPGSGGLTVAERMLVLPPN
jgi:sugar lactone lactonase YvrE